MTNGQLSLLSADPPRIAPSRTLVRGILFGALCGLVGGPSVVVVAAILSVFVAGLAGVYLAVFALLPAVIVGGVVGAAVGFVGAALAIAGCAIAPPTARGRSTAASIGAALGSGGTIAVAMLLFSPLPNLAPILAPVFALVAGGVAARIAWRSIGALAVDPAALVRELWSGRVLLAGFVLGVVALVQSMVVLADPFWWSWEPVASGSPPIAALAALVVMAPTAAVLLVAGVWLAVDKLTSSVTSALILVAVLFIATALGAAGFSPREERVAQSYSGPSYPVEPEVPETPPVVVPVEPVLPEVATTLFTVADITAASQAQIDATIAAVGPINDPAIAPGTTTFPAGIGGCNNVAGGRVNFEVWFLVDDLDGGFARARDAWLAQGFVLDATRESGSVEVTGAPGSLITRMTLENKSGTVKFTVESVCVAGEDY